MVPLSDGITNWAQEVLEQSGIQPCLIGYLDIASDPRAMDRFDPRQERWDGGYLRGLKNLAEGTSIGSAAWLLERGIAEQLGPDIMATIEKPSFVSWNGFRGNLSWLEVPKGVRARDDAPLLDDGFPAPACYRKEDSDTYLLTSQAMDFVRDQASAKQPWALHLSLLRPHPPFLAPEPYNSRYHPSSVDLPTSRAATADMESKVHPFLRAEHAQGTMRPVVRQDSCTVAELSEAELRRERASYYGLIAEVDDNVGRLMSCLEEAGEASSTLVILTSDHGELLGDHHLRGKLGFHDGAYHVPLIIYDPRSTAEATRGRTVEAFTEHVDLAPTILDYLGLRVHRQFDGRSLRPFMEDVAAAPSRWRQAAHFEYDFRHRDSGAMLRKELGLTMDECTILTLRTRTRKLVHFGGSMPLLLFDLEKDPDELFDVSGDVAYSRDMQALLSELLTWRMKHACRALTHLRLTSDFALMRSDDAGSSVDSRREEPRSLSYLSDDPIAKRLRSTV